jgi:hypothetical protein
VLGGLSRNDRKLIKESESVGGMLAQNPRGRCLQEHLDLITHGSFR